MRVSIVTPSFNQAQYLEQTIDSVLSQNYPDLEYIIIDGGSTDGSVEIIRKHAEHLKFWVSEPDQGQAQAINKGLRHATGELLAYLNSDDIYLPGALARIADEADKKPDADLFYGQCAIINQNGDPIETLQGSIGSFAEIVNLWDIWWLDRYFVQPEVFWTRRVFQQVGPFQERLRYVMDFEYWTRIFRVGARAEFIDLPLAAFRRHANQKTIQVEQTREELMQVVEPLLWDRSTPLQPADRTYLQGRWMLHCCEQLTQISKEKSETDFQKTNRLLRLILRHPGILRNRPFQLWVEQEYELKSLYRTVFLAEVEGSLQRRDSRWLRLLRLSGVLLRYPQLFAYTDFRERLHAMLSGH